MATVTGFTASRMLAIEDASIVSGTVIGNNLVLTRHDGSTVDAGNVRGPAGPITTSKLGDIKIKALDITDPGWAKCDGGTETEGALYSALISAGNPFGTFEGNPRRPDTRNKFIVGAGSAYALGASGGAASVTLSTAQIPAHAHSLSAPRVINSDTGGTNGWMDTGDVTGSQSYPTDSQGGGGAHENLPPYVALFQFIYTLDGAAPGDIVEGMTVVVLTQAEYDLLDPPDPDVLYVITD